MNIDSFIYLEQLRKIAGKLPGVTEGVCFGTPAFYVNKKLLVRLKEDGESLMMHTQERDKWIKANPKVYYVTEHYLNYPSMLLHLSKIKPKELEILFFTAWKLRTNKTQLKEYDPGKSKKD